MGEELRSADYSAISSAIYNEHSVYSQSTMKHDGEHQVDCNDVMNEVIPPSTDAGIVGEDGFEGAEIEGDDGMDGMNGMEAMESINNELPPPLAPPPGMSD